VTKGTHGHNIITKGNTYTSTSVQAAPPLLLTERVEPGAPATSLAPLADDAMARQFFKPPAVCCTQLAPLSNDL
jgi:hypothetical protein